MFYLLVLSAWAHRLRGDPLVEAATKLFESPCSCDCCSTQRRLPGEQKNGLTLKCGPSPQGETDLCPANCAPSSSDIVLTAAEGPLDYGRYCILKCRPLADAVGAVCIRQTISEAEDAQDDTGNGNSDTGASAPATNGTGDGLGGDQDAQAQEQQAKKQLAEQDGKDPVKIEYDIRKVIKESRRARAAASMANAAGSMSRADLDAMRAALVAKHVEFAAHAVTSTGMAEAAAESDIKAKAVGTADDADQAVDFLRQAKVESRKVAMNAADAAVKEIRAQGKDLARREAEADAIRYGWDKPDFWPRVLAGRAADPYLREMVTATQRVSEYEQFAKNLFGKAEGAQAKAKKLANEMNVYITQGNRIGEAKIREEIATLLDSANSLHGQAQQYWKVANETRLMIPEWQKAAMMAASHMAYDFSTATKELK